MAPVRVLIVDDSVFMRTILKDMLVKDAGIEVVGTASDGVDALQQIKALAPDVVTLDIEMPRMGGLEVLTRLAMMKRPPRTLVLSSLTSADAEMTKRAIGLGADDFMLKPRDVAKTRGIERELQDRIHHLIAIPRSPKRPICTSRPADCAVVIGSSAGGPQMLDHLLSSIKPDLRAGIIVTQHMPLGFTAPLAARLNRISPLPVKESENGGILEEGQVVVSKAGFHSVISGMMADDGRRGGKIVHSTAPPVHAVRPAVDTTFTSAARTFRSRTVSILLSGMGSDGGEGTASVKEQGGVTMVCNEHDCLVYGMARSALKRGCVDRVIPLVEIAREIESAVEALEGR
jgi:two-component system, chemotaxis family, protein-glutamate methylesterase/glutaminase